MLIRGVQILAAEEEANVIVAGDARGIGVPECAIDGARRAYEWGARGDDGRCRGSGEEEPESEDIWSYRVS